MSETVRGVIVFVAALFTIALWVPLSGEGRAREGGGSVNEIYFGLFRYLVVHSEMKEPDFKITKELQPVRLAVTVALSGGLWVAMVMFVIKKKSLSADRTDPE